MAKKNKTPFLLKFIPWAFPKVEKIAPSLAHKYFIHLFYTPFKYKTPEKEKELIKTAHEFSVTVNDKRIQAYRWGTMGPKILLVHGWAGRAGQFRGIIPALLANGYQCVAFDGPAHGRSEGKQTTPVEFADTIKAMGDDFHGMIAHSFGGVAALYAISTGYSIKKLINISSPTIAEQVILNFRHAVNASAAAGQAFRDHIIKTYGFPFEEISALHLVQNLPAPLDLFLIQDEQDPEVAPENAAELLRVYPSANVLFTKDLGHTRILRDEAVISSILNFVSQ
jgi:pimeloyl-ACP methyl ester carboxylesterase